MIAAALLAEYVPVVFVYGMGASPAEFDGMRAALEAAYPGIYTACKRIGHGAVSTVDWPMDAQAAEFARLVAEDPRLAAGFNVLTHSQGGVIGRLYVERYNDPPVRRLVTLAAPHGGFFCGVRSRCPPPLGLFTGFIERHVYSAAVQATVGPAGYWRSPYQEDAYLAGSRVQPALDNERDYNETYKRNLLSLDYFVMVGSPEDGMITPWQSQFFGFWRGDTDEAVDEMRDRRIYREDLIGLRTLDGSGRLVTVVADNIGHTDYWLEKHATWMRDNVWSWFNDVF